MLINVPASIPAATLVQALAYAGLRLSPHRDALGVHQVEQIPKPGNVVFMHPRYRRPTAPEVA